VGQLSGIPCGVLDRAEAIKLLLAAGEHVEPLAVGGHNADQRRGRDYEAICGKFLSFDCATDDVPAFLSDVWCTTTTAPAAAAAAAAKSSLTLN
jgi:hypothetical protein